MSLSNSVFKNTLLSAVVTMGALTSVVAYAVEPESYDIQLSASIPDDAFHVRPVNSGWINDVQELHWDFASEKFSNLEELFQFKNTSGAIQATITNANSTGQAIMTDGTNIIPLTVTFNGVTVSNVATEVVDETSAQAGGRANLVISTGDQNYPSGTYSGNYTGSVAIVFEPKV